MESFGVFELIGRIKVNNQDVIHIFCRNSTWHSAFKTLDNKLEWCPECHKFLYIAPELTLPDGSNNFWLYCKECGFVGEINTIASKTKCPDCETGLREWKEQFVGDKPPGVPINNKDFYYLSWLSW